MSPDDKESVRQLIAESFAAREPPAGKEIVAASISGDAEVRALCAAFIGKRWQDIDAAQVARFKDALPLLTPVGFAYFLPAYLLASLEAPQQVDTAVDSVLFNLTPPQSGRGWRWRFFNERASQFSAAQARAIAAFLDYQADFEAQDWAAAGKAPPRERVGRPRSYWRHVVGEASSSP